MSDLIVMPKKDLEKIYQFVLSLPAKDVLEILKSFENVRHAEEKSSEVVDVESSTQE